MIIRIEDQTVIGKDDALRVSFLSLIINVALGVLPSLFIRQLSFIVAKPVAADALARGQLSEAVAAFCETANAAAGA